MSNQMNLLPLITLARQIVFYFSVSCLYSASSLMSARRYALARVRCLGLDPTVKQLPSGSETSTYATNRL